MQPNPSEPKVYGLALDEQSRCAHYRSALDILAIKFKCCGRFYACRECHDACEQHPAHIWAPADFHEHALLCGACKQTQTIDSYLGDGGRCPRCSAPFNPGCRLHRHLYFRVADEEG